LEPYLGDPIVRAEPVVEVIDGQVAAGGEEPRRDQRGGQPGESKDTHGPTVGAAPATQHPAHSPTRPRSRDPDVVRVRHSITVDGRNALPSTAAERGAGRIVAR